MKLYYVLSWSDELYNINSIHTKQERYNIISFIIISLRHVSHIHSTIAKEKCATKMDTP
jgi:hypothetical protein